MTTTHFCTGQRVALVDARGGYRFGTIEALPSREEPPAGDWALIFFPAVGWSESHPLERLVPFDDIPEQKRLTWTGEKP